MICIAVCDDEKNMSDHIKKMTRDFFRRKNVEVSILQFSGGEELLQYDKKIDILFLDIQMEKMDGMETAKKLRKRKFQGFLIFVTVLKEMVFQAFEVQAYDYLVKPVEAGAFAKMMERLFASLQNADESGLLVQKGYESRIISLEDIVFCEIIDRKIYLHLSTSEVVDYYERIEKLEARLGSGFFRCHRSYLINPDYLSQYGDGQVMLDNGERIPVSKNYRQALMKRMMEYMEEEP